MSRTTKSSEATAAQAMRTMAHHRYVADLREGRVQRATTFTDRKKAASKRACRDWKRSAA